MMDGVEVLADQQPGLPLDLGQHLEVLAAGQLADDRAELIAAHLAAGKRRILNASRFSA